MDEVFDVLVIGAGAAGLMAAWELVQTGKKTAIIEARDYTGGRMHTVTDDNFDLPVELGAEFVHGDLDMTKWLLDKAGASKYEIRGAIWQKEDGSFEEQKDFIEDYSKLNKILKEIKEDISVASFFETRLKGKEFEELRFTLKNYVEGYYAADIRKASTLAMKEELTTSDDTQYRIEGGYVKLVDFLSQECSKKGVRFFLSHPVKKIEWQKNKVVVSTAQQQFSSLKILITVPIGVLQSGSIDFTPALPAAMEAAKQLGFGPVIKTMLQFEYPFWKNKNSTRGKDMDDLSFIFSRAVIPTWWTYHPKKAAMLTGWSGGVHAEEIKDLSDKAIVEKGLKSLSQIFDIDAGTLQHQLRGWRVANWVNDPYSCGGYSYEVVNGSAFKQVIKKPVEDTLYFAGEGLYEGPEIGTVEAALFTGRETAHQLIAAFKS